MELKPSDRGNQRMTGRLLRSAVAIALLAAGCGQVADGTANGGLDRTAWTVVSIAGTATIAGSQPTMSLAQDGTVTGTDGCNQYSARFATDGGTFSTSQIASTLLRCEPLLDAQGRAFIQALVGATEWRLTQAGTLELAGQGDIVAEPTANDPSADPSAATELGGTRWILADMDGSADFARLVLTLEFGRDGMVTGFAGCNTFDGPYALTGDEISLGPLATTKIACEPPASAVEAAYLPALDAAGTWSVDDAGQLLLSGPVMLTFRPD